jgi:hypothetical protein
MLSLFSSIKSGDLSSAQSAYSDLTSLLSSTSSTSSASSTSSSSSSSTSFSDLLKEVGTALNSGNISSAQSVLDTFMKNIATGTLINTTA